jgi:hypothetical protein
VGFTAAGWGWGGFVGFLCSVFLWVVCVLFFWVGGFGVVRAGLLGFGVVFWCWP